MSTLWTPSGEHQPSNAQGTGAATTGEGPTSGAEEALTPEEDAALIAELHRRREELAATPVVDIVANHAIGLWQLAVLHLTPEPSADGSPAEARLDEARLAVDAFAAIVEGLGNRLAPHEDALRDALTQLRLAYVEVSGSVD